MAYMGHSSLSQMDRYIKRLPQPGDLTEAQRLHTYERGFRKIDEAQAA
jgi:hypothetical protein